jgi:hypothetical protein
MCYYAGFGFIHLNLKPVALKKNPIQPSPNTPIMNTPLTLPSLRVEYKSPWTVFRNKIPTGSENAPLILENQCNSVIFSGEVLTSPCYLFDLPFSYP